MVIEKFERLTPEQAGIFKAVIDECNRFDGTHYPFDPDDDSSRGKGANHFILYHQNEPAALVFLFTPTLKQAEVYGFTRPQYRRKGLFKDLLTIIEEETRRSGFESLLFVCQRDSEGGQSFIHSQGLRREFSEYAMIWKGEEPFLTSMEVSLRPAIPGDKADLVKINHQAFGDPLPETESIVDLFLSSGQRDFYTILKDNKVIGMIGRYIEESRDYIHGFCIDSAYRGRGFGRQALGWMVRHCRELDPSRSIELEVETENENALELYRSCGFRVESVFDYYRREL